MLRGRMLRGCALRRRRGFFLLLALAIEDQHFPDMLHRRGIQRIAHSCEQLLSRLAIVAVDLELHELMGEQVHVDLVQHRRRQPLVADADHRVEVMRLGTQGPAFRRRQFHDV